MNCRLTKPKTDSLLILRWLRNIVKFMLLTPHTIVGVTIATSIHNPLVAVPLAFAFHFFGDMVPHWDFYTATTREQRIKGWRPLAVMADLAIGVALGVTFTLQALWVYHDRSLALNIFLCGIASVLPDVLTGPSIYLSKAPKLFNGIHKLQSKMQFPANLPWGVISQLIVSVVCFLLIQNSVK